MVPPPGRWPLPRRRAAGVLARVRGWPRLLVAAGVLVGLALDVRARGHGLPSWKRQVDEAWLTRYRGWVYGLGFGLQLGAGVLTIVTSSTVYAVLLLAAWSGQLWVGLLLGLVFGVARALPILTLHDVQSPGDLHRFFGRLDRWARPVDRLARGCAGADGDRRGRLGMELTMGRPGTG